MKVHSEPDKLSFSFQAIFKLWDDNLMKLLAEPRTPNNLFFVHYLLSLSKILMKFNLSLKNSFEYTNTYYYMNA